jgi:hypothetical protein
MKTMKPDEEKISKIERALFSVHRHRKDERMSARLRTEIMRDLRTATAGKNEAPERISPRAVWKFAATASLVAVLLLFYTFRSDLGAEYEAAAFLGDDYLIATSFDLQ